MRELPFAISLPPASSAGNRTGAWRTERPVFVTMHPPCEQACPAGEEVRTWLHLAQEGRYEEAWRVLMAANPLPAVMGRICYHPCETSCNRGQVDETVGINAVERFLGDEAIRRDWTVPVRARPSGKRVLVVGSGPAGLSAAYHLRLAGHGVTVRDAAPEPGGMMRYGIPAYRLPRDVLDVEIYRIAAMGVRFDLASPVTDLLEAQHDGSYDAVFLAVGAQVGRRAYLPAGDSARVLDALSLLHAVRDDEPPRLGRHVVVYGGGNTAMDAARTAVRLGASDAVVVYRRTRERMPAHDDEVAEALAEGVRMRWLSTITEVDGGKLTVERMELDSSGFPQPTGEYEELTADSVVLALGQQADLALLDGVPGVRIAGGVVQVGPDLMTGRPGIFAGGDAVPSERTATVAVGHGRTAARHIDAWLAGTPAPAPVDPPPAADATASTPGTTRTPPPPPAPNSTRPDVATPSTKSSVASTKPPPSTNPAAACPAAPASNATPATPSAPTTPSSSSAPARATSSTRTTARAAACAPPNAPAAPSTWSPNRPDRRHGNALPCRRPVLTRRRPRPTAPCVSPARCPWAR
jgi:NADPH-dependent glutamate synthase beta subunit-like oxidoreductase